MVVACITQAGKLVKATSSLHQLVVNMMTKHPGVREEDGLSLVQWLQEMVLVPNPSSWVGDLELRRSE